MDGEVMPCLVDPRVDGAQAAIYQRHLLPMAIPGKGLMWL